MSVWKFFLYSNHGRPMWASVPKFKSQLSRHFHNKNYSPDSTEHAALQFYNIAGFTFFSPMNMVQQNILFFLLHSLSRIFAFALFSFHSIRLFSSIPVIYGTHKHDISFFNIFRNFFQFPISMVHQSLIHSKQMDKNKRIETLTHCFGTNTSFLYRNRNRPTHNTMEADRTTKKPDKM